jgi:hypothetical protein
MALQRHWCVGRHGPAPVDAQPRGGATPPLAVGLLHQIRELVKSTSRRASLAASEGDQWPLRGQRSLECIPIFRDDCCD